MRDIKYKEKTEMKCSICPRGCNIDRTSSIGFCGEKTMRISHVMLHHWEEPLISGDEISIGSGTIFFSGCNLKCVYCQNYEISSNSNGNLTTPEKLVEIMKDLEQKGALNINFVTPTHFSEEIVDALKLYKPAIPIVWNTSGYESIETLNKLKGLVDIFLSDLKYYSNDLSNKYSNCHNYFDIASKAVLKMREIVGEDEIVEGLMKKGLIIRHMVLPSCSADSIKILNWIKSNLGNSTIVSIMNQYTPCYKAKNFPEISRMLKPIEYARVVSHTRTLGFTSAFIQDESSASTDFIPKFK